MRRKFGRVYIPDKRDDNYIIHVAKSARTHRTWRRPVLLDQGNEPQCVAYAWLHFLHDYPYPHKSPIPLFKAQLIYDLARVYDEFPGEDYEGSSVRGGAEAVINLIEEYQLANYSIEYRWARTLKQCINTVLNIGPLVAGTNWYPSMNYPSKSGWIRLEKGEEPEGGHAYVICGVNLNEERFTIQNSWKDWGIKQCAYIGFKDFMRLVREDGEMCIAVEKSTPAKGGMPKRRPSLRLAA